MTGFPEPRRWSRDELATARLAAITDFVAGRNAEGAESYAAMLEEAEAEVARLFDASANLTTVESALVADAALAAPLRHTAGPPISEDDLAVLADVRKRPKAYTKAEIRRINRLLAAARDRGRFPWLDAHRRSTEAERRAAILSSAALWATQRMATKRRTESSQGQERRVREFLATRGFIEVPARRAINAIDDLARGEFCAESPVAGTKADVCIRLHNGRLLLIECKVSGSAINSYKRLIHDIGDKESAWSRAFGNQIYTMGVIAGVFKLANLVEAQETKRIFIVWERDLGPLGDFLAGAV